jgi:cytidylate kinase
VVVSGLTGSGNHTLSLLFSELHGALNNNALSGAE